MDCNSYSYAPYMLDEQHNYIEQMDDEENCFTAELEQLPRGRGYLVTAYSYTGDFDYIEETHESREAALARYNEIVTAARRAGAFTIVAE